MRVSLVKYKVFIIFLVVLSCAGIWMLSQGMGNKICLSDFVECSIRIGESKSEEITMSEQDANALMRLIDGHRFFKDMLSCGFSEKASLRIECSGQSIILFFALDGCPYLYSPQNSRYLRLTKEEMADLHALVELYGLRFPCV